MIALAALALAQAAPPPPIVRITTETRYARVTDDEICEQMRGIVRGMMAELPVMVDTVTRVDGVSVICSLRSYTTNRTILANLSDMREGWRERKQSQWNEIICGSEAFLPMARRGWLFAQNLTFLTGERFVMDADCPPIRRR